MPTVSVKTFALEILKAASAAGFDIEVIDKGRILYAGQAWTDAWEAVRSVGGPATVYIAADGRREWMRVCAHRRNPDETVIDGPDDGGWIDRAWSRLFEESQQGAWNQTTPFEARTRRSR